MFTPSRAALEALRSQGTICPIYLEILADLETPLSAFVKIARGPQAFLFESVEGGTHVARYSFLGCEPRWTASFTAAGDGVDAEIVHASGARELRRVADPLAMLGELLGQPRPVRLPDMPRFVGGLVGYLGYEAVRCFEQLPLAHQPGYPMPLGVWMAVDTLLVFDHLRHTIRIVSHVRLDAPDLDAEYAAATARIAELATRLRAPLPAGLPAVAQPLPVPLDGPASGRASSNLTEAEYYAAIARAHEYIVAGDIFQVVIGQRFTRPTTADALSIYRALRVINPSPYMFYLRLPQGDLVGASPELLVRVEDGLIETHPIAGTRRRSADPDEDDRLAAELAADEKERAEHLMLVDLGRNDIGRVSRPGTVRVPAFMQVERYSHVMHLVSRVTGELRPELRALDALRACFPAGTLSGAPKIRAMQIIAELEPNQRGVYGGCVGYVGYNGDLDTCIAIRTAALVNGIAYVQAGGGIVADSDPPSERLESLNKAEAVLRAIEAAERL